VSSPSGFENAPPDDASLTAPHRTHRSLHHVHRPGTGRLAADFTGPRDQKVLIFLFDPTPGGPMRDETPLPDGFESITVAANGTRLHAVVGGSGEPVLLLHGRPQTWRAWRHLMPALAAHGYRVVAPDLRGTGASDRPPSGYDKDTQTQDMRELLAQLGIHSGVRIVGHDIGGMVAFAYARRHPEEVEHLVLVELALPGLGLEQAMDVASGGLFHFGLFMTEELPELLLEGRESDFLTWWFDWLSAVPGTFPPEEIATVASSYRGADTKHCAPASRTTAHSLRTAASTRPGTKPEEPSPCPYSPSAASTAQTPDSPTV
jgi:pimeloyl-ACP methyl ester carboxylesterase